MKTIRLIDLLKMLVDNRYEDMPKKIEYCDYTFEYTGLNYYSRVKDEYLERYIALEDLEQPVYILDEEDEFEDIKEVDLGILNDQSSKNREFKIRINQLIKNQKKIIDKLNKQNI